MTQAQAQTATQRVTPIMIGRAVDRVDGLAKTTGAAPFSTDYPLPGLAYAALTYSTIACGRILAIDTRTAAALPGVLAVITHLNAPAMKPPPRQSMLNLVSLAPGTSVNYLNTDEVLFNGQPVALVVAESIEAAAEGAALIDVRYQACPAAVDFTVEQANAVPQKNTMAQVGSATKGDAEAALAAAPVLVDAIYTTPQHQHNAIEPHAATARWDGDRLTVYDGTQNIDWTRRHLAQRFDVPAGGVRVISRFTGGAFGGKTMVWAGTVLTALAARVVQRPVAMMLTREGVYRTVGGRTPTIQRVALGAGRDGHLTSLIHASIAQVGRTGGGPEQVTSVSRDMYAAPNMAIQQSNVTMDAVPNTVMRAPGEATGTFALESAMDELAVALLQPGTVERVRMAQTDGMTAPEPLAAIPQQFPLRFALGYEAPRTGSPLLGDSCFGHAGLGGRLAFADPATGAGVGYTCWLPWTAAPARRAPALSCAVISFTSETRIRKEGHASPAYPDQSTFPPELRQVLAQVPQHAAFDMLSHSGGHRAAVPAAGTGPVHLPGTAGAHPGNLSS